MGSLADSLKYTGLYVILYKLEKTTQNLFLTQYLNVAENH